MIYTPYIRGSPMYRVEPVPGDQITIPIPTPSGIPMTPGPQNPYFRPWLTNFQQSFNPVYNTSEPYGTVAPYNASDSSPSWEQPFKDAAWEINFFLKWVEEMSTTAIPNLVQAPANALATLITAAGRYPTGAIFTLILIFGLLIALGIFFFLA